MMKQRIYYKSMLLVFGLLFSGAIVAQEVVSKQINKSFPLTQNGALELTNKYGDVTVNGWDKEEVEITISVDSKGKDKTVAKELLDRIQPEIKFINNKVTINSTILKKEEGLLRKFLNKIQTTISDKADSQINYIIFMPQGADLKIINKYGNLTVFDWDGYLDATIEHGDINLSQEIEESNLSITYGKLKAYNLQKGVINANDATLNITTASQLAIVTNGSTISIDDINNLQLDSNKDDIEINTINALDGKAKYGTILVNALSEKIKMNLSLTELKIARFSSPNPLLRIDQENSQVYLNISNTSFKFNANLEQGVLRLPKTMLNIQSDLLDKKKMIRSITANYGSQDGRIFSFTGFKGIIILKEL